MLSCKRDAVEWENRVVRVHKAFELKFAVVVLVLVTTTTTADNYPHCAVLLWVKLLLLVIHSLCIAAVIYTLFTVQLCVRGWSNIVAKKKTLQEERREWIRPTS